MSKPSKRTSIQPAAKPPEPAPAVSAPAPARVLPSWFLPSTVGFLLLATLLAYSNSFHAAFSLDNTLVLLADYRLRAFTLDNLHLIFTQNYWWPSFPSNLYRPLTTLSYLCNWTVLGSAEHPPGYHVVNYLLHGANSILLLVVARRITARPWLALLAASLFALHPVETESVTNVVGRADELVTFWILTAFWCHLRAADSSGGRRLGWVVGLGFASATGLFCKENALMLVGLLPLYDWLFRWPALTGNWRERLSKAAVEFGLKSYVALVPGIALFFTMRHILMQTSPIYGELFVDNPIAHAGPIQGFLTAVKVLGRYLALLVFPRTLSCDYSYNQVPLYGADASRWENVQCWLALLLVSGLVGLSLLNGLGLWGRTRRPLLAFGVLFFFGMIMPTANILFPIGSIMAERFLYLPSIGFCLVAAPALLWLGRKAGGLLVAPTSRGGTAVALILPGLVLAALGARTYARNDDWKDEFSLWTSAVEAAPNSFKVHKGLSNGFWNSTHSEAGADKAIASAEIGLAVLDAHPLSDDRKDNTLFIDLGMYYTAKAQLLRDRGAEAEARLFFQKAVDIMTRAKEVDTWVNQAARKAQLGRGRPPNEIPDVGNFKVHLYLAIALNSLQRWDEAAAAAAYGCHLAPMQPDAHFYLAFALANRGQLEEAAINLLQTVMVQNDHQQAWSNLVRLYTGLGQNPLPVGQMPNGSWALDPEHNAMMRKDLTLACAGLVQLLLDCKEPQMAKIFRDRSINDYKCPPEQLPAIP